MFCCCKVTLKYGQCFNAYNTHTQNAQLNTSLRKKNRFNNFKKNIHLNSLYMVKEHHNDEYKLQQLQHKCK